MVRCKWEYLVILVGQDGNVLRDEETSSQWGGLEFDTIALPLLGAEGWELCAIIPGPTIIELHGGVEPVDVVVVSHGFYFKRPAGELQA